MVERHKDFGLQRATAEDAEELEPITFTLYDETFECYPRIPGALVLRFIREVDSGDGARVADGLLTFFDKVIIPDDKDRWDELTGDMEKAIDTETLAQVARWLIETYSERPTKPPPSSRAGRRASSRTSKEEPPTDT